MELKPTIYRFLLKYSSRDEVDVLSRGAGGLPEVQAAIAHYEERSPLYGFIQYRRRKVILKFLPDGTSRLLQGQYLCSASQTTANAGKARVSVHFQSVTEKLTPHDTIFSFAKASELHDSTLSSACSLHTASASLKSSNDSLPQRGLAGITEDASEPPPDVDKDHAVQESVGRGIRESLNSKKSYSGTEEVNAHTSARNRSASFDQSPLRPRTTSNTDKALPPTPGELLREKTSSETTTGYDDFDRTPNLDGRVSSQSARPSTRDLHSAYENKPKVKLGPRPSIDSVGRPDNMNLRDADLRPVSSLPAGVRMPPRKAVPVRRKSQQPQGSPPDVTMRDEPPLTVSVIATQLPPRQLSIPRNGLPTPTKTPEPKSTKMTPEKRRLMKALQLRQKQMAAKKEASEIKFASLQNNPEFSQPEIDETILNAIVDASASNGNADDVYVDARDLSKHESRNLQDSPISIPEPSEGPSTQASSIADEEDVSAHKENDIAPTSVPTVADEPLRVTEDFIEPQPTPTISDEHGIIVSEVNGQITKCASSLIDNTVVSDHSIPLAEHASAEDGKTETGRRDAVDDESEHGRSVPLESKSAGEQTNFALVKERQPLPEESEPSSLGKEAMAIEASSITNVDGTALENHQGGNAGDVPSMILILPPSHRDRASGGANARQNEALVVTSDEVDLTPLSPSSVNALTDGLKPLEVPLPANEEDQVNSPEPDTSSLGDSPMSKSSAKAEISSSAKLMDSDRGSHGSDRTTTPDLTLDPLVDRHNGGQARGQGVANPMKRVSSPEHSDEHLLSDDSLMDELNSATVQEAKPVSVSKSPMKPVFSRSVSDQKHIASGKESRSVSSPLDISHKGEEALSLQRLLKPPSSRSFSASQSQRPEIEASTLPLPKKIGVSSGISQRIRALEKLSSRPTSPSSQLSSPNPSTFISVRKTSVRTVEKSNNSQDTNDRSRPSTAHASPSPSSEAVESHLINFSHHLEKARPETVSVTATIVRDASNETPELPLNLSEPRALPLHHSPIRIEHQNIEPPPLSPLQPPRPRYARRSSARSNSSSSTEQKLESTQAARRDSFASRHSTSSRAGSEIELPRTTSESSLSGTTSQDAGKEEKKDSKRSRLLKRMSSISSLSRRSIAHALSSSPKEDAIIEYQEPVMEALPAPVDVGDVNIQFPDTLVSLSRKLGIMFIELIDF